MEIQRNEHGAVLVVKPEGPLVGKDGDQCGTLLKETLREKLGRVVLDASAIQYVDSEGLEALVDVSDELAESGQTLKLCSVNETVRQVLELTGLAGRFEHFDDANSAVRSFL